MLNRLEHIISKDIPNLIRMNCEIDEVLVEDFKKALRDEAERVKIGITSRVTEVVKKKLVRRYIRQQQHSLIMLNAQLVNHVQPEHITVPSKLCEPVALYHHLYKTLDDLLSFMERHFTGYFEAEAWLPVSYRLIAAQEIRQGIDRLEAQLLVADVDEELVKIIFHEFRRFLDMELDNQVTWRKAKYLKDLKEALLTLLEVHAEEHLTEPVRLLLISLNFNNLSFSTWYTNFIISEMNTVEDSKLRLEKLTFCAKQVNQVRDRHGYTLDLNYRPVKQQIAAWMAEELSFHHTSQLKFEIDTPVTLADGSRKLELDMPVPEISCLLWGLKGTGIMKNNVMLEVFDIVASMFSSRRQEALSSESIRNHYYSIEYKARIMMAEKFQAMADLLRSGKSPGKPQRKP